MPSNLLSGLTSSILWTAQGIFIAENSEEKDRGYLFGFFFTFYRSAGILGNFLVVILLNEKFEMKSIYLILFFVGCFGFVCHFVCFF